MKPAFLLFLLFFLCTVATAQLDYVDYNKDIVNAEKLFLTNNFSLSMAQYRRLFNKYPKALALRYKSNNFNWLSFCSLKYCN